MKLDLILQDFHTQTVSFSQAVFTLASLHITPSVHLCRLSPLALTGKKTSKQLNMTTASARRFYPVPLTFLSDYQARRGSLIIREATVWQEAKGLLGKHPNPYLSGDVCGI